MAVFRVEKSRGYTVMSKETIDSFNTSETRGRELSHGLNFQKLGKELMTQDEIAVMDGGKCILQMYLAATGCAPVLFRQVRYNAAPELQIPLRL